IGATVLDPNGRVLFWNTRLIDILGVQGDDFAEAASLAFGGNTRIRDTLLEEMRRHGRVRDAAISQTMPDGREIAALIALVPVRFERARGVRPWVYDIAAQRRAQEASDAAARAKSAFLATMSHETRTPMNGVVTMAELLAETPLTRDQAGIVRTISESGRT